MPPSSRTAFPETGTLRAPARVARSEAVDRAHVEDLRAVRRRGELLRLRLRADERPAIELHDPLHVRRARRRDPGGLGDEERDVVVRQGRVEAPLEPDRRRRLRAHRLAAERPRDVAGVHLDAVPELDEPAKGVEEPLGALARFDREVGPRGVADEERVAGEDDPGLGPRVRSMTARQQCSGRWPGVWMQRRTTSPSAISSPSSIGSCGYSAPATGWMLTGMPCSSASRPWPETWSACVCVSIDADDAHIAPLGLLEVLLDRESRVDDDGLPVPGSPTRYDAHPSASSTNCVKIMAAPDRTSGSRYFS